MNGSNITTRTLWMAVATVGFVIVAGCGDDSGVAARFPVKGTVKYKGEDLKHGEINFVPASPGQGRAATGSIEDGWYTLTTVTPGDGALPGKYKVTITSRNVDLSGVMEKSKAVGIVDQTAVGKAVKTAQSLIPVKYNLPDTSRLTAEVKEESNSFDFELTD